MKNLTKVLSVLLLILICNCFFQNCFLNAEKPAVQKIPGRPDPESGPTELSIIVWVLDIDSIDSASQNFRANLYLEIAWKDKRLAHSSRARKRYRALDVWTPQIQILNETGIVRRTFPEVVDVTSNGEVRYRQRFVGPFSQPLNLKDFPFDKQIFQIHFVAAGHNESEVMFVPDKRFTSKNVKDASGFTKKISLPDWTVKSHRAGSLPFVSSPQARKPAAGYVFEFVAFRNATYYIIKVILPLCLIVFISWIVFWIDPSKFAVQMTISITSMLTLIAYRFSVDIQIPRVSYMTRLDFFMLLSTILIFLSIIEVVIVSQIAGGANMDLAKRIDRYSRIIFPVIFFFTIFFFLIFGVY
jgi:hypothetical protein